MASSSKPSIIIPKIITPVESITHSNTTEDDIYALSSTAYSHYRCVTSENNNKYLKNKYLKKTKIVKGYIEDNYSNDSK